MSQRLSPTSFWIRQHRLLVEGIGFGVMALLVAVLVTVPFVERVFTMRADLSKSNDQLVEIESQVFFLSNLDGEILKKRVGLLDTVLPASKDVLLYLSTIDGLARELSLTLRGIELAPGDIGGGGKQVVGKTGTSTLDTELVITGTQDKIYAFLRAVEETAPLMTVKDVKVNRLSSENFSLSVVLSMVYAVPETKDNFKGKSALFSEKEESVLTQIAGFRAYGSSLALDNPAVQIGKTNLFEPLTTVQQ